MPWTWFLVRDLHPYLEVIAVVLPPAVLVVMIALVVAAALLRESRLFVATASWALFAGAAVLLPWLPSSTGRPINGVTVAVANVLADNTQPAQAAADILAVDADVVVVPEDTPAVHEHLAEAYPFAHYDPDDGASVGVYARVPATVLSDADGIFDDERHSRVRIGGGAPFVLWALHLPRPWFVASGSYQMRPRQHARTLDAVIDGMARERLPVVAAGDLNLTDRGRGYRRITDDFDDAMRSISGRRTSLKATFRPLLLRIDHILVPEDWCADEARRFRISGSDHRGVTARIGPCRPR